MPRKRKKISKNFRMQLVFVFCIIIGIVFILRLLSLQVFGGKEYVEMAEKQRQASIEIKPIRGDILDRDGEKLAYSLNVNNLYINPLAVEDKISFAREISAVVGKDEGEILSNLETDEIFLLKEEISNEELELLERKSLIGVSIVQENKRVYSDGNLAPHVLGFIDGEGKGVYGVEESYNDLLAGKVGSSLLSLGPYGDIIPYTAPELNEAEEGKDIMLTLDSRIQELTLNYIQSTADLYDPSRISVIVMNPNNGEILAMSDYPQYNNSEPRKANSQEQEEAWDRMTDEEIVNEYYKNWTNFSTQEVYEPGSIFKFITAASAYDSGSISQSTVFNCEGTVDVEGEVLRCHRWFHPHGEQSLVEAMDNSCNPAFIQMAESLGGQKMYEYAKAFGFGEKTGICLNESTGLGPSSPDEITPVSLATMSYGHGIATTPIQVATAVSAVVNGGNLYKPSLVKGIESDDKGKIEILEKQLVRRVISEETSEYMRYMMRHGVEEGTADGGDLKGYDVGGKTGTSEKFIDGEYSPNVTVGSYVGIYPSSNPKYLILAVVDEAKGATSGNVVAAPLVRNIISGIISIEADPPQFPNELEDEKKIIVPDLIGMSLSEAAETLSSMNLNYTIINADIESYSIIEDQAPNPGVEVELGQTVDLIGY